MEFTTDRLPEQLAEILEALWTLEEKGKDAPEEIFHEAGTQVTAEHLGALRRQDLITIDNAQRVRLAKEGRKLAERIIRRHRLAERLICDALGAHVDDSEDAACEFEHILAEGIANSICTLLGHPRFCPHGKPIPEGECCRRTQEELQPILVSGDQLDVGETGTIAYLCTTEHARMLKLSSLGMTPGNRLKLLQKWPSCVFQCDETEIAVEQEVARNIYVRREGRRGR
ncbi:MAG: metal-dependent transcriptional regulator [Acidobacteriia bacterium]|nr:metal-dependent transcriptional regulator [Terriglobia bacterium]